MTNGNRNPAPKRPLLSSFAGGGGPASVSPSTNRRVSAARLALAIKRLRAETSEIDLLASEPIAIIGLGCRFPGGASDPEKYWQMLENGGDAIRRVPEGRWPHSKDIPEHLHYGGYLEEIDGFDAAFFGITPREAQTIDPQQRLLLEVTWEALWNAGLQPEELTGKAVGVFAAIYSSDYSRMQLNRATEAVPNAVGAAHSIAAGRISFLLNLKGPCLAIDTACSSSLVAIHLACQSLRARECDTAISGGVSLKVLPDELLVLNRMGMLSKTSRCHTFDEKADGFVPGEGCGVIVLKRLADALADRDPIRAVIRGTAVNHDGRTTVLTAPSGLAHEAVIRQALKNGAVEAEDVTYVETHGTGTSLGDPIELQAVQSVYGASTPEENNCIIGAVKSNLGHLEAAAGFAGLIKVVLAMEHGNIPKNLHFTQLNPQSSLNGSRLKIAEHQEAWPRGNHTRLAGVSSLGFGGTNAHMIVEEAPVLPGVSKPSIAPRAWQRVSFWLPPEPRKTERSQKQTSPLTGVWLNSPFLQGKVYELVLDERSVQYAKQHVTGGQSIVSGSLLLEMILPIVQQAVGEDSFRWIDAQAGEPLVLATAKRVQVSVEDDRVEVVSETVTGWHTHLVTKFESMLGALQGAVNNDFSKRIWPTETLASEEIEERVRREAAAVMEMPEAALPVDVPLINLGLDSMMAADLRNRLQAFAGQELPPNFAFNHPTVEEMAQEVGARLWAVRETDPSSLTSDQTEEVEL